MTPSESFRAEAATRILIKDGAYGTSIQDRKLKSGDYCGSLDLLKDQRGNNDLLNITKPDVVRSICASFADAGAEILATNSFNANAISQSDYGAEHLVGDINRAAARITREVADRDGKEALGRRCPRADEQDTFPFPERQRPGISRSRFRPDEGRLPRAD